MVTATASKSRIEGDIAGTRASLKMQWMLATHVLRVFVLLLWCVEVDWRRQRGRSVLAGEVDSPFEEQGRVKTQVFVWASTATLGWGFQGSCIS